MSERKAPSKLWVISPGPIEGLGRQQQRQQLRINDRSEDIKHAVRYAKNPDRPDPLESLVVARPGYGPLTGPTSLDSVIRGWDSLYFSEQNDAHAALRSIQLCHQAGIYPPVAALALLSTAFEKYIEFNGKKSLDEILKLKPGKRGKSHPSVSRYSGRDQLIFEAMVHIHWIVSYGFTVAVAAKAVSANRKALGDQLPKGFSPRSLEDLYSSDWSKRLSPLKKAKIEAALLLDKRDVSRISAESMLRQFPTLKDHLKKKP